ncbi:MAG: 4-hydroxy-tetrahydrodipicolinate reductase [Spirochaetes bacterium]|nr:4-hydroxy-tetrahydrodipicolinate reductase [Spirochaetota bacterium]MBN2771638.1 4-hydroxy-tetrahydrodipicolinate reductase [Spirochaetota bacterium]
MSVVSICGFGGRMGQAIARSLYSKGHSVGNSFDIPSSPFYGKDPALEVVGRNSGAIVGEISASAIKDVDCVVDFSAPAAAMKILDAAVEASKPLVIATTGLDSDMEKRIEDASKKIAIVYATNMSVGVNLLFKLAEMAAGVLGGSYDAEVFEAHHRNKKDSPSGTASTIINHIRKGHRDFEKCTEAYRDRGIIGERTDNEIGVQVLRGGDIVGEHTAFFCGLGERIEITHRATDRRVLADGAVRASEFVVSAKPGLYSMLDVLNIG